MRRGYRSDATRRFHPERRHAGLRVLLCKRHQAPARGLILFCSCERFVTPAVSGRAFYGFFQATLAAPRKGQSSFRITRIGICERNSPSVSFCSRPAPKLPCFTLGTTLPAIPPPM